MVRDRGGREGRDREREGERKEGGSLEYKHCHLLQNIKTWPFYLLTIATYNNKCITFIIIMSIEFLLEHTDKYKCF